MTLVMRRILHPRMRIALVSIVVGLEIGLLYVRYRPDLGDLGILAAQGSAIVERGDALANPLFAVGPLAALAGWLLTGLLHWPSLVNLVLPLLNVAGVLFMLREFFGVRNRAEVLPLLLLIPLTTPFRVGFADVQVAGVLLLLLASSHHLAAGARTYWQWSAVGLLSAVALDMKPAMALTFFVVMLVSRGLGLLLATACMWLFTHLLIDLWLGEVLELRWLQRLGERAQEALAPGPESSPWQLAYGAGLAPEIGRVAEAALMLALLAMAAGLTHRWGISAGALLAAAVPLTVGYQHLYDTLALAALALLALLRAANPRLALVAGTLLLPAVDMGVTALGVIAAVAAAVSLAVSLQRGRVHVELVPLLMLPSVGLGILQQGGPQGLDSLPWFLLGALMLALLAAGPAVRTIVERSHTTSGAA